MVPISDENVPILPDRRLFNTPADLKAEADAKQAKIDADNKRRDDDLFAKEAARLEDNKVKFLPADDPIYLKAVTQGRISDYEVLQLRKGGDRHYRDGDPTWRVATYPPGQVILEPHDPDGNGIPNGFWVTAIVPVANVIVYNGVKGKTFRQTTF